MEGVGRGPFGQVEREVAGFPRGSVWDVGRGQTREDLL